jgi:hypothetical protein
VTRWFRSGVSQHQPEFLFNPLRNCRNPRFATGRLPHDEIRARLVHGRCGVEACELGTEEKDLC